MLFPLNEEVIIGPITYTSEQFTCKKNKRTKTESNFPICISEARSILNHFVKLKLQYRREY